MSAGLLAPADIMNHQIADLGIPADSISSGAALDKPDLALKWGDQ
jgi:hypothetical protein